MRAVLNREANVRLHLDDEYGALVAADSTPTVSAVNGDGQSVAVGTAASEATGLYAASLSAQSVMDRLTVSWNATVAGKARTATQHVDVVSERLVPLWRLREDAELLALDGKLLQRLEDTVAEWFRNALKYPPVVESYRYQWLQDYATQRLRVPGVKFPVSLTSLAYGRGNGQTVWTPSMLAQIAVVETGFEYLDSGTFAPMDFLRGWDRGTFVAGYYTAHVTHGGGGDFGITSPTEDMRRAAAILCRYAARVNNLPERARRIETAASIIDLSMPSADKPTGLPDVDAVIGRYRLQAL
jgi:hypothetical protein